MSERESTSFQKFVWRVDAFLYKYMTEKIPNFLGYILSPWSKSKIVQRVYRKIDDTLLDLYNFWDMHIVPILIGE